MGLVFGGIHPNEPTDWLMRNCEVAFYSDSGKKFYSSKGNDFFKAEVISNAYIWTIHLTDTLSLKKGIYYFGFKLICKAGRCDIDGYHTFDFYNNHQDHQVSYVSLNSNNSNFPDSIPTINIYGTKSNFTTGNRYFFPKIRLE
jgi:hypothetical protein